MFGFILQQAPQIVRAIKAAPLVVSRVLPWGARALQFGMGAVTRVPLLSRVVARAPNAVVATPFLSRMLPWATRGSKMVVGSAAHDLPFLSKVLHGVQRAAGVLVVPQSVMLFLSNKSKKDAAAAAVQQAQRNGQVKSCTISHLPRLDPL